MNEPILNIEEIKKRPKIAKVTANKVYRSDLVKDVLIEAVDIPLGEGCNDCYFNANKGDDVLGKFNRAKLCEKYACTPSCRKDKRNVKFILRKEVQDVEE